MCFNVNECEWKSYAQASYCLFMFNYGQHGPKYLFKLDSEIR